MINLYFKITLHKKDHYFHSEYDDKYILWKKERIFAEFREEMYSNQSLFNDKIKSYRERELGIFGIFLFTDKLIN
jgi:hypothetical protein